MDFTYLLKDKDMSVYECSKRSGIPYSTLMDIMKGNTLIERVSARNLHALSETLQMTMDALYSEMIVPERSDFELFKSSVCHRVKELGDIEFIIETLESGEIRRLFNRGWYPESLYRLAMLDYLSKENGIARCTDFDDLRAVRLEQPVFPASVIAVCLASGNENAKREALKNAIPEFMRHNIVESEVRDVA